MARPPAPTISPTFRKVLWRIIPLLLLLQVFNSLDRINIGFAALTMNVDIGLSAAAYGLGAGLFFIGYFLFEIPSNLIMNRVGARVWITRIAITWGLISSLHFLISSPSTFYLARILLGVAEAGFFPAVTLYLLRWSPARLRASVISIYYISVPIANSIGAILSSWLIDHPLFGLTGWRTMFLIEGLPTVLLGLVTLFLLPDSPQTAKFLTEAEKDEIATLLAEDGPTTAVHTSWREDIREAGRALKRPRIIGLSLCFVSFSVATFGVGYFLPLMLRGFSELAGHQFSVMETGLWTAIPYAVVACFMLVYSRVVDRAARPSGWFVSVPLLIGAVAITSASLFSSPYVLLILVSVGLSTSLGLGPVFWKTSTPLIGDADNQRSAGIAGATAAASVALINATGNLGGFAGPYTIGWISDATGSYKGGLIVVGVVMVIGASVLAAIYRNYYRRLPGPTAAVTDQSAA
ncbi:MAG: MFS transporter [Propionibacteriaceae bacterium]|jgi:MFS family permease|nr:MFS transporter [Propionibacteriaceae bacterium]